MSGVCRLPLLCKTLILGRTVVGQRGSETFTHFAPFVDIPPSPTFWLDVFSILKQSYLLSEKCWLFIPSLAHNHRGLLPQFPATPDAAFHCACRATRTCTATGSAEAWLSTAQSGWSSSLHQAGKPLHYYTSRNRQNSAIGWVLWLTYDIRSQPQGTCLKDAQSHWNPHNGMIGRHPKWMIV